MPVYGARWVHRILVPSPKNAEEFLENLHIVLHFDGAFVLPVIPIPDIIEYQRSNLLL